MDLNLLNLTHHLLNIYDKLDMYHATKKKKKLIILLKKYNKYIWMYKPVSNVNNFIIVFILKLSVINILLFRT